jgi:hypothetical protein
MKMSSSIRGLDAAYDLVFNMLSHGSLKQMASIIHPPVPLSSSPLRLRNEIAHYVMKNYGKIATKFYPGLVSIILEMVNERALSAELDEPKTEEELKPLIRKGIRNIGFIAYDTEIPIPPGTRADIVAYKGRRSVRRVRTGLFSHETKTTKWHEFLGVELKTAKRGKDPMYRQVSVYAQYFDHAFTVITPLTLLRQTSNSYEFFRHFYREMKAKGVGIVLATDRRILGTILASKHNSIQTSKRRYLDRHITI